MILRTITSYSALHSKYPVTMSTTTTAILSFTGDYLCQRIEQYYDNKVINSSSKFSWNSTRSLRFGLVGMGLGPQLSIWYKFLATKLFPTKANSNAAITAFKRMSVDQIFFSPFAISYVFTATSLLEGKGPSGALDRIRNQLWSACLVNWSVWPFTQIINFWLIPPEFRVIIANLVGLWFNTYMSYASHKSISVKTQ